MCSKDNAVLSLNKIRGTRMQRGNNEWREITFRGFENQIPEEGVYLHRKSITVKYVEIMKRSFLVNPCNFSRYNYVVICG